MKILTNYDFMQNQILNVVIQKLATPPSNPVAGQIYFNTQNNRLFVYDGEKWVGADALDATMTGADIVTAINTQGEKISLVNVDVGVFSSSKDGLVPKGSGTTKYLRGDGTWQTPPDTKVTVVDNLSSTSATSALSAKQGKVLKDDLDLKETITGATQKANTAESNAKLYADGVASVAENNANDYTDQEIANLVGSAPEVLDTLEEIAQALGSNPNFATTITTELAKKTDKFTQKVGNGTLTNIEVNHNLNTRDVVVMLRETASPYAQVITDVEMATENKIILKFAKAPANEEYTVTVIG